MKQQRNKKQQNRRRQMADTMVDVIGMFDQTYGKPDERKTETPEQLRRAVDRLCGVSRRVSRKGENQE